MGVALRVGVLGVLVPLCLATVADFGNFNTYGWCPENRDSSTKKDDYRRVRVEQVNGYFTETVPLYPVNEQGKGSASTGFAMKRYALENNPNYMLTVLVQNEGRCPVYMSSMAFTNETYRDITGPSHDFWNGQDPNSATNDLNYLQMCYQMNRGVSVGIGNKAGVACTGNNWIDSTAGPQYDTDMVIYEGKFVDGKDTDSVYKQYTRFPISYNAATGECTEAPSEMPYLAFDIAHVTDTVGESKITFTEFPGAFDDTTYKGCSVTQGVNVTVIIRWVDMRLFTNTSSYPSTETPRAFAKAIAVSTDTHTDRYYYAGTFTITRADDAYEQFITSYVVYSYYEVNGVKTKCTGIPFLTITKDWCKTHSTTSRQCSYTKLGSDAGNNYQFSSQVNLNCQNFIVVSQNDAGEDPMDWINYASNIPVTTFTDVTTSSKAEQEPQIIPEQQDTTAQPKFVFSGDTITSTLTGSEGGRWYTREIDGYLDNVYRTNIGGTIETDSDMMNSAFNVPYHRWLFEPSDMSAWSVQITTTQTYSSTSKLGLKGFAVLPQTFCVARNLTGSWYYKPAEIKALCDIDPTDDFMWFDLTSTKTNTWSQNCNDLADKAYQVLLVVEDGFSANYHLTFKYQDFYSEVTQSTDKLVTLFRGCIKKGQTRDFSVLFNSTYSIVDAAIVNGTQVEGIYLAPGTSPATQSNNVASDSYSSDWSSRLSASLECTTSGKTNTESGQWNVRVYKDTSSSLSEDTVEFVLQVKLRSNEIHAVGNGTYFDSGSITGFVSDGIAHIYNFTVPGGQQLVVDVTRSQGTLNAVALQMGSCPSVVPSSCVTTDTQVCKVVYTPTNGVYQVQVDAADVQSEDTFWYVMVLGRTKVSNSVIDECAYTLSYSYVPKPPPTETPVPTLLTCSRFSMFCGETWIENSAMSCTWSLALIFAGLLVGLVL